MAQVTGASAVPAMTDRSREPGPTALVQAVLRAALGAVNRLGSGSSVNGTTVVSASGATNSFL